MGIQLKHRTLTEFILRRNLTQNGFASKAGISSAYIAQLLAGKRTPSARIREKLLTATGMDFDDLFLIIDAEETVHA